MSKYSDEEKAAVLARARATLAEPMPERVVPNENNYPPFESPSAKWRREATEEMERAEREKRANDHRTIERRITNAVMTSLQGLIDQAMASERAEIGQAVAAERAHMMELLPELLAKMRAEIRRSITAEINAAVGELRAEVNVARAVDKSANVIDMPDFLKRAS
jgi:CYTH domain-containing protein